MKTATICAVPTSGATGYAWIWRCSPADTSATAFEFYYDCVTDARQHGYAVELMHAHGATAPGGATFRLGRTGG